MQREVELREPAALRALAHPVRIRLVGLLRRDGPLTASEAARRLGESSGSTSYHLRQLARFGLVEEAGRRSGGGRERPWRATALHTAWPNVPDTPELEEASRVLERIVLGRYVERLERWFDHRSEEAPAWGEAAALGDSLLYLDVDELSALRDALRALADPYLERLTRPELRPPGARPVLFVQVAIPDDEL